MIMRATRFKRRFPFLVAVLCLAATTAMGNAWAAGANDRFQQALKYYQEADFAKSIAELEAARKEATTSDLLGKIELYLGINYTVLSKMELAENAFKEALIHTPTLLVDSRRHKSLVSQTFFTVKAGMKGRLVVVGANDAAVFVDGKNIGTSPLNENVSIGIHRLKVLSKDGNSQFTQKLLIQYNEETKVNALLTPIKGWLNLNSEPSGAEVFLDGKSLGKTPLKARALSAGKYRLLVQLTDTQKKEVNVVIPPLAEASVDVKFAEQNKVVAKPTPIKIKPNDKPPTKDPAAGSRLWTWVGLGGTVAAAAIGIGLGAAAQSDNSAWKTEADATQAQSLRDSGQSKQLGANICYGLAGALAITTVVLFFVEGRSPAESSAGNKKPSRSASVVPLFGETTGLMLEGRF